MLKPDLRVDSFQDVTPEVLRARGVEAVMVDMDDTLIPSDQDTPLPGVLEWLRSLVASGLRVLILSNGTSERVAKLAKLAGVHGIAMAGKPLKSAFRRGLELLGGVEASRTAMVGDQLFTDVLGANRAGIKSILVRPLSKGKLPHTRLVRRIERMFLKES